MIFGVRLLERLLIEAARASWFKNAHKCRVNDDFVQIQDANGVTIYAINRFDAPQYTLQNFRNAVRH